jgi:hypothetical protein
MSELLAGRPLPWRVDGWGIRDADDIPIAEASPEVASAVVVLVNGATAGEALTKRYSDHIFDGDSMCCEACLDIASATRAATTGADTTSPRR